MRDYQKRDRIIYGRPRVGSVRQCYSVIKRLWKEKKRPPVSKEVAKEMGVGLNTAFLLIAELKYRGMLMEHELTPVNICIDVWFDESEEKEL